VTLYGFTKFGKDVELYMGFDYILVQSAPCALLKLIDFLGWKTDYTKGDFAKTNENHSVTIYDARKTNFGSFGETGFTLIELEEEPETTDWRTPLAMNPDADIKKFHQQMEPHIMKLYPQTKRMKWTYNVVRGGDTFGDQPRAVGDKEKGFVGAPHLDYHQNATARVEFHQKYPINEYWMPDTEPSLMMGSGDDDESKLGVLLGVWKPIHPTTTVCDFPLAVMDARTFKPEHQGKNELHLNFGFFRFHNLNGVISYCPEQKWAYYSFQTTKEVLVFHQYSSNKFYANPHTSFFNKNCPEGSEKRVSVEMRLALYF